MAKLYSIHRVNRNLGSSIKVCGGFRTIKEAREAIARCEQNVPAGNGITYVALKA